MKTSYFSKRKTGEHTPQSLKTQSRLALKLVPAATILIAVAICASISAQTITTFDAPGAGTGAGQGTRAYSINPSGTITGHFTDSVNTAHGYVRSNQGVITVFDAPGAGTGLGRGTFPTFSPLLVSPNGAITGLYIDSAFVS